MGLFKGLFKAGVVVGGIAAIGYVAERSLLAKLEQNPDEDPYWRPFTPPGETVKVATHDGATLRAVVAGTGSPIVLVHGLMVSVDAWAPIFEELVAAGHKVIAYDLRGHGGSGVGDDGWAMEQLGKDLRSVLEHFDVRDAIVVGHSMGGMATQTFALEHPDIARERVAGIVLASTSAGGIFDIPQNKAQLAALKAGLAEWLIAHKMHGPLLASINFGRNPRASQVKGLNALHGATESDTIRHAPLTLEPFDVRSSLKDFKIPTLVIHGKQDKTLLPEGAQLLADEIPGAKLEWMETVGHMAHWEDPMAFTDLVLDFAKERQVASAG